MWNITCKGERRVSFRVLEGKTERNCPPGRPRHKFEGTVKIYTYLQE
jgi:hypothetical protein